MSRIGLARILFIFVSTRKRYDRAEKEFVESKLHLFGSLERKDLLTDHLCTIIEQVGCLVIMLPDCIL